MVYGEVGTPPLIVTRVLLFWSSLSMCDKNNRCNKISLDSQ